MAKNILTKSDKYTSEYACTIVKIGEVKPIEGKDKIGYTFVNGESIVVRKDQVKEGDVLIYASNETQLNKDFLGANNLFESGAYELNANAKEVEPYILENKGLKAKIEKNEKTCSSVETCLDYIYEQYVKDLEEADGEAEKEMVENRCKHFHEKLKKIIGDNDKDMFIEEKINKTEEMKKKVEENLTFIRAHVGFFNKTGRVRAIRLGGVQSMGYLFSLDELAKYNEKVKDINLDELVGEDFDTVDGELFVKAYVPYVPERKVKDRAKKRNKHIEKFDRMVKGEFSFHYDTQPFPKCVQLFKPTDKVVISNKLHGTSGIFAKVHVKTPIKLPILKRLWNMFVDTTHLFKSRRITDYVVEYGNVTSSRTVIKNQYINKEVTGGFYGVDLWTEYGELIYPYLEEGMTLYGEICGYVTNSDKMIQKGYDYGCEKGKNFLMPYRITTTNEDGTKKEWNTEDVKVWTDELTKKYPELAERIHPMTIFYHGTLGDLYPELSVEEHWHENLLEKMREDKKRFGMEKNEPMCINKVPREGLCIRKDDDEFAECFKLKCMSFLDKERKLMDDIASGKEEISEEMAETYS